MPISALRAARLRQIVAKLDAKLLMLLSAARPSRARQDEVVRLEALRGAALRRLAEAERG